MHVNCVRHTLLVFSTFSNMSQPSPPAILVFIASERNPDPLAIISNLLILPAPDNHYSTFYVDGFA